MNHPLYSTLLSIHEKLLKNDDRLVLAESCTSGLAAAELGQIPGISKTFCGSMVVYQTESKTAWLGVDPERLASAQFGPVSQWASETLARQVLLATPHATISAAITGHLGPSNEANEGHIFMAMLRRTADQLVLNERILESASPMDSRDIAGRKMRQQEATNAFLLWIDSLLVC